MWMYADLEDRQQKLAVSSQHLLHKQG